jgi:hypothetical protein
VVVASDESMARLVEVRRKEYARGQ